MLKNKKMILLLTLVALSVSAMADYSDILKQNEAAVTALQSGISPWAKLFVAGLPIVGFVVGVVGFVAYHWQKAEEQRKDKLKIAIFAVGAGFILGWATYAVIEAIVAAATGKEDAAKTVINALWNDVFEL